MHPSIRLVVGVGALVCGAICGLIGTFTMFDMIDQVNSGLPRENQFDLLGWYWSRYGRLFREY